MTISAFAGAGVVDADADADDDTGIVELGGGHDVVGGTGSPGHGFSCSTRTGDGSGSARRFPSSRGPLPSERYGMRSNWFGGMLAPKEMSSGKM